MGAACTRAKGTTTPAATPGAARGTPEQQLRGTPVANVQTGTASQQVVNRSLRDATVRAAGTAPNTVMSAEEEKSHSSVSAVADLEAFTLGDGCGVYLVEQKAFHGTLVTQYSKESPTADEGLVLLQVKPPPYRPISPSRFTLQGGKRVLKQNIKASTKNAAGQAKYCGLIVDFVRLADTYKGFLWASPDLDEAIQPFSVFIVETRQRTSAVSAFQRRRSAPSQAVGNNQQQERDGTGVAPVRLTRGEGEETGAARETAGEKHEQPGAGGKDNVGTEESACSDSGRDDQTLYVQYLETESAFSYRLLERCGILPLPLAKAKEIIPPWTAVASLERLRKKVVGAGKMKLVKKQNSLKKTKVSPWVFRSSAG